jgi:hypothetical protein
MEVLMFSNGDYSNEFEAAYDKARQEYDPADELDKIVAHIEAGKFVVVIEVEACCPYTDALLGVERRVGSVHDTKDAAMADAKALGGGAYVMGPDDRLPTERAMDAALGELLYDYDNDDEDIPF